MRSYWQILPAALAGLTLLALAAGGDEPNPEERKRLKARLDELDRGVVTNQMRGRYAEAARLAQEQLDVARRLYPATKYPHGHHEIVMGLVMLANALGPQGEFARAEPLLRQALAMSRRLYPVKQFPDGHDDLVAALNNLGLFLVRQGEFARAETLLAEGLAVQRKLHAREPTAKTAFALAMSLNNLGSAYEHQGEYARAVPLYRDAVALRRKNFPGGSRALAMNLSNLGTTLKLLGDYDGAEPVLREALAMRRRLYPREKFPRGHADVLASLNNLATLLEGRGNLAAAEPVYGEALAMAGDLYPPALYPEGHPNALIVLTNVAQFWERRGRYARAAPLARQALAGYRAQVARRAGVAAEAEALNFIASLPRVRDCYLACTAKLTEDPAVYEAVWDTKAALTRVLEARHRDSMAGADPAARDLARRLREARRDLARLALAPAADAAAHARRLKELTDAKEELERRLARQLKLTAPSAAARLTSEALREQLPEKAVFLDLVRYLTLQPGPGDEQRAARYAAFVVRKGEPTQRVELGEAAPIEEALRRWRLQIAGRGPAARDNERRLSELVWKPLARHLAADTGTVYLAPDAELTAVPWAALPGRARGKVLLEEHALTLVPHGPFLLDRLRTGAGPTTGKGTVLAVGALAYGRPPPGARARWHDLKGTEPELAQVLARAGDRPVIVRRGGDGTVTRLYQDLEKVCYAHLATHGFFDDQAGRAIVGLSAGAFRHGRLGERIGPGKRNPLLLSGLVLSGANKATGSAEAAASDGGILLAEDIVGLNLHRMELAVLSACETGLGEVAGGEGVFGLQRAFHVAGCKNVVASLWQVDDEATAALMGLFYHKLWKEGLPPVEALRQAQLTLYRHPERIAALSRRRGPDFEETAALPAAAPTSEARAAARLWAGFVLSGSGR
jgi:CHAT domain-containing protein/tetratricopeptide (TPR) repeat protein